MKLKKFKERNNKQIGIIIFTITCILLVSGVMLYRTFAIFEVKTNQNVIKGIVQDPGDIYFAYYVDEKIQKEMPQKNEGYILDEEKSYCGELGSKNETIIPTLNKEDWSITIKGMKTSRTKCNLYFRNYYKVKVDEQEYQVQTSSSDLKLENEPTGNILLCNNGITAKEEEDGIHLSNITKDSTCRFYNTSNEAINHIDNSENYILFLNDETSQSIMTITNLQEVTIDLNGHTKNGNIKNDGKLILQSTNTKKGVLEDNSTGYVIDAANIHSVINIQNMKITGIVGNRISGVSNIENSEVTCNNNDASSAIYLSTTTILNISNSKITGPFGIGGAGCFVSIDNSEITGNVHYGIANNTGRVEILIKNGSKIVGERQGIRIQGYGTITLDGTSELSPTIIGSNYYGVELPNVLLIWNYGEIFGKWEPIIPDSSVIRTGTTMTTEDKDGMKHTFLQ